MEFTGKSTNGKPQRKNVLEEAMDITSGARREAYGHPRDNFKKIADLWSGYLGYNISSEDVAMLMVLLKVARHHHLPKHDNLVDICGYARTAELLNE